MLCNNVAGYKYFGEPHYLYLQSVVSYHIITQHHILNVFIYFQNLIVKYPSEKLPDIKIQHHITGFHFRDYLQLTSITFTQYIYDG